MHQYTKNPLVVFNSMTLALGKGANAKTEQWIQDLENGEHHLFWLRNATISGEVLPHLDDEKALNRVLVQVGDEIVYTEEVLAQLLAKARQYATTEAGAPVKDCAITVPYYWSHAQRQALLDAANLAGFNVLSLLNQNLAIAIKFLTDRDFEDGPKHVVFYDMGTSDLQVSLYRFESAKGKGKTKWVNEATLLATATDSSLGGSAFDSIIVDAWMEKLRADFGKDFELSPQSTTKLQKQAKRAKEVLSANKESRVVIESIIGDYDFKASITREEFENRAQALIDRTLVPLKKVVEAAGLTPQQIDFFEMFGGGARIPKIQDGLRAYLDPVPLSRHLNTDEAAAFGAAIYAASKSSQHRVKDFNVKDGSNAYYPVLVRATDADGKSLVDAEEDGSDLDKILYKESSRLGSRRTLKIKTDKDIYVELKYPPTVHLEEGVSHLIGKYRISFPEDLYTRHNATDTPTAHVRFELTSSGTVVLTGADAQLPTVTYRTVKIRPPKPTPEESPASDATEASDSTYEENSNDENAEPGADANANESADTEEDSNNAETEDKVVEEEAPAEEKTEIREIHSTANVRLQLTPITTVGLDVTQLADARRRLKVLDEVEKLRLETEHAKSDLEALIYSIYDKLEDSETIKFSTSTERSDLSDQLGVSANWLEEDGADALKAEYLEKKNALNTTWTKITRRIFEHTALPKSIDICRSVIEFSRDQLKKIEEVRNVTAAEVEGVRDTMDKVELFLAETLQAEQDRPLYEDPKTVSTQVQARCREFTWRIEYLSKKPKKRVVEPKPATPAADSANQNAEGTSSTSEEKSTEQTTPEGSHAHDQQTNDAGAHGSEETTQSKEEL